MSEKVSKVLMIGPGRKVMGGISTVVNSYYELDLDQRIELRYIASMEDGSKLKKLFVAAKAYIQFCWVLKKYDIIHVHMAAQASFSRKSLFVKKAHKARKHIIIHQHAADFDDYFIKQSNNKKREKIKSIFAMADKIIVLSSEWADFYQKYVCDEKKIVILHNAVIMPNYKKDNYSDHGVLFLGRLGIRKGVYDLMEAIPKVLGKVSDAMFYLGGDGDVEQCKKISQTQGTEEHVQMLGWIEGRRKEEYLKSTSILILPSYHEGMPMAVLEAMSYGMAVISTDVGGIPQIIENGVSGICIKAGDIETMAEVIVDLLQHPNKKKRIGQSAVMRIQGKFNAKEKIEELCDLYHQLLYEQ